MKNIASSVWLPVLGGIVAIAAVTYVFAWIFNGIQHGRLERAQDQARQEGRELTTEERDLRFHTIELF